jgi:methylated-DNA-[protein]-cysteine S-methyltransferase
MSTGFALFETPIGSCGIAWSERGIAALQLPEGSAERTRARFLRRFPDRSEASPPADVQRVIDAILSLLRGEPADLSTVSLDYHDVPEFNRRVYELARAIPPGTTVTYGEIATRLGDRSAAREVGQALSQNPIAIIVPCHRVVAANGKTGGFSARGGVSTKLRLLALEGAPTNLPLPLFAST